MMDGRINISTTFHVTPLIDTWWLWLAAFLSLCLLAGALLRYRNGAMMRMVMLTAFILALLQPSLLQEERAHVKDVAVLVVDQSASQNMGERTKRTEQARIYIERAIQETESYDLRIVQAPHTQTMSNRTDLFTALDQALTDVPKKRRAGIVFLSDGQIHDIPKTETTFNDYGPTHLLLSGDKNEKDRQIQITNAPAYGLVGKQLTIKFRVEDTPNIRRDTALVTLTHHDGKQERKTVSIGQENSMRITLEHPGQNVFTLDVEPVAGELTQANNKTAILMNGVRDRLKVLLVSGVPHSGERTWRDLLTSDPGVDLVHFTILREPQKFDYTPKNELSLIAFPFRELFEVKLYDFDLIIFDRYRVNNILPDRYFRNIVKYVEDGGAFLESSGPAFATTRSIYDTPLGAILPAAPTGTVYERPFTPTITDIGQQHPVTKSLVWKDKNQNWGAWMRYIDVSPKQGDTLINGPNEKPVLVLNRHKKGRVAQLSSDHIWLWSRGYDGGGPHAELLRRIVHWLMKEPELDERALDIRVNNNSITLSKQGYGEREETLAMSTPSGGIETVTLTPGENDLLSKTIAVNDLGIYSFEDALGTRKYAIIGDLDPPELRGIKTTDDVLKPIIEASGGTAIWLQDNPRPLLKSLSAGTARYGGKNWLALRQNDDFTIKEVRDTPLLPHWATLLILLTLLSVTWWKEGKA